MAVSALARQGEDKIIRQAYQRRKDEIYFYNKNMAEKEQAERIAKELLVEKEQAERRAEQAERKTEQVEVENEKLRQQLAAFQAGSKA